MLKPFDQIAEPDFRNTLFRRLHSASGHFVHVSLEDRYAEVERLAPSAAAPKPVADQFDRARHAYVYGWFVYELGSVAELLSYTTMETALRLRAESETPQPPSGFRPLLELAIARGWISDNEEAFVRHVRQAEMYLPAPPGASFDFPDLPVRRYLDALVETMPKFRNAYAHGHMLLNTPGHALLAIEIAHEVIGQLFPD